MSITGPVTNVYYLAPPAVERPDPLVVGLPLRLRLLAAWWRVRLTARDVTSALRRFGRPLVHAEAMFLEQRGELILAATRPSAGPARIIDFAAARKRLRA